MILDLLRSDLLKTKKIAWLLVLFGPIGVVGLQFINYSLRYDHLLSVHPDHGYFFLVNVHAFWPPALLLGITLIISLQASIEHRKNLWKQILILPVRREQVYLSKLFLIVTMLLLTSLFLVGWTYVTGIYFGFTNEFSLLQAFQMSFYTLFAAWPFVLLQFWLSMHFKNQGAALTVGIASAAFIMYAQGVPDWLPWKWPLLLDGFSESLSTSVLYGSILGIVFALLSMLVLTRKDVH
ncbi:ABC transporter permease [Halalkalibacterium halodurans]|uniref:ABC transporter permease n=1 Tax=Halalkalibacterium halodurans TaxID=86665 RepID=UPI002E21A82F|nr:ABC transporter permease [Halalkalibacterium halodurans]